MSSSTAQLSTARTARRGIREKPMGLGGIFRKIVGCRAMLMARLAAFVTTSIKIKGSKFTIDSIGWMVKLVGFWKALQVRAHLRIRFVATT
jgi:hypothetical protein